MPCLWWHADDLSLPNTARKLIQAPDTQVLVNAASAWEIATKARIGKLHGVQRLLADYDALIEADQFTHLHIRHDHARLAGSFDSAHRVPESVGTGVHLCATRRQHTTLIWIGSNA
jgi:PIN domain nuclease of toxin-antitoxin system